MEWLNKIIPTIGTLLGGPLGGAAVEAVGNALGLSDKTKASVEKALSGNSLTPEQIAALQTADVAFKQKLAELGIEAEKLAVQDRADARTMQITSGSWVPAALAVSITLGFFGILIGLMTGDLKMWDNAGLQMMLGSLGTAWGSICAFYYGASHQQPKP